jgi:hypothetical protein
MVDAYVGFWFHCSPDPEIKRESGNKGGKGYDSAAY